MEQKMTWEEMQFFEYLQGGPLPKGKEEWIALKAQIELAAMEAFRRQELYEIGYHGPDNEFLRVASF